MTKDRVTYFSDHDGSIWMYRPRFVEVMDAPELMCGSLVDALELYHIKLFVEKGLLKSSFDADVWQGYQKKARIIPEKIARFINEASSGDLVKGDYFKAYYDWCDSQIKDYTECCRSMK